MKNLTDIIGGVDIYLLDQILKERYSPNERILDAGCGNGRNLKWFYNNPFQVYGVDADVVKIQHCKTRYQNQKRNFSVAQLVDLSFEDSFFDHVICCAVLHFATDEKHFISMFSELIRVIKPNGTLFIRVASNIGLEKQVQHIRNGVYNLPDGTKRFLLKKSTLHKLVALHSLAFIEPVKTTNVDDKRCMTTLVFKKTAL